MEVDKHQKRRVFAASHRTNGTNRRQRIGTRRGSRVITHLPRHVQSSINIPRRQSPLLSMAKPSDFQKGVFMLAALNPDSTETRSHVFR